MQRRFRPPLLALIVTLAVVALGVRLGLWQLSRAEEKRTWLASMEQRAQETRGLRELLVLPDPAGYRISARGHFDNEHNILLDNRMLDGIAGYHVLTPFHSEGVQVLVNRGWIPRGPDRARLPAVPPLTGEQHVSGTAYIYSDRTFTLSDQVLDEPPAWPLRVQKVETRALGEVLGVELAPFEIRVAPDADLEAGPEFPRRWREGVSGPERHQAYALQWFLLAAAALAVFVAASFRREP